MSNVVVSRPSRRKPSFRLSDIWKAPLHDFPVRDEILYQYLPLSPEMELLEIGPGSGYTAFRMSRHLCHLTLVDVAAETVEDLREQLRGSKNVSIHWADVAKPGLGAQLKRQFDVVFGLDVFEYVRDPATCLDNLASVLRPGGRLFLTFPNMPPSQGDGVTRFSTTAELEELLRAAGFQRWQVFSVRLRWGVAAAYLVAHEWPLELYRWLRRGNRDARPQTYEATWAFRHRRQLTRYKILLHGWWVVIGLLLRLGGDVFEAEPAADSLLGRQAVIPT